MIIFTFLKRLGLDNQKKNGKSASAPFPRPGGFSRPPRHLLKAFFKGEKRGKNEYNPPFSQTPPGIL